MSRAIVLTLLTLAACGREPPATARKVAAETLGCKIWEVSFPAIDDDGVTAECHGVGLYLERAGDQWIVMQTFPLTAAADTP